MKTYDTREAALERIQMILRLHQNDGLTVAQIAERFSITQWNVYYI